MDSASSFFPAPRRMLVRGAPPIPMRAAKAEMIMMMGIDTPTPVRAAAPTPSIRPMYIRSTMLYRALMSWAVMAGMDSFSTSLKMFPLAN